MTLGYTEVPNQELAKLRKDLQEARRLLEECADEFAHLGHPKTAAHIRAFLGEK